MSGAGAMLRAEAILDVLQDRSVLFAETSDNLVEDFELTLELKRHGWKCVNNYYCRAETDLMLSVGDLMKQRYRWVHGTINELRRRGWKRETRTSIMTMWYALLSIPVFHLWPMLLAYHVVMGSPQIYDFWFLLFVVAFQVISVRNLGWKSMVIAGLLLPDLLFGVLRHAWILKSLYNAYVPQVLLYRSKPQYSW
jgi:cellulose synthase/poly-beta-1,6-N-acetylglucosamine synthase-like glycosyltransferase